MKTKGMVIGTKIVRNSSEPGKRDGIVELTIVENTVAKVKTSILSMMAGKTDAGEIIKEVQKQQQLQYIIYITIDEYIKYSYNIGSHVEIDTIREDDNIYRGEKIDDNK